MATYIRVVNTRTLDAFWVDECDRPKLGTDDKVTVYETLPRGCYKGSQGSFKCVRKMPVARKFIGLVLAEVSACEKCPECGEPITADD